MELMNLRSVDYQARGRFHLQSIRPTQKFQLSKLQFRLEASGRSSAAMSQSFAVRTFETGLDESSPAAQASIKNQQTYEGSSLPSFSQHHVRCTNAVLAAATFILAATRMDDL